jgi:hypothetical protein
MASRLRKALGVAVVCVLVAKGGCYMAMRTPAESLLQGGERADLLGRRNNLVHRVEGDFERTALSPGGDMFPGEWALGTLSMLAAAETNLAFLYPETRQEALEHVPRYIEKAMTSQARAFDRRPWGEDPLDSLAGDHGHVGYLGHVNLMLGAYRLLGGGSQFESLHRRVTAALARRMNASVSAHIETYPGHIFTADMAVAAASIAVYDQATGEDHGATLGRYVRHTRTHLLDAETGLVVFKVDGQGRPLGVARGCGVGWNSFYLPMVDEAFASEQFERMRARMVKRTWFGVTGIREYPPGQSGHGDVDSGPVILELSTSGTGFAVAGARHAKDTELLGELLATAELVGTTVVWGERRWYLAAPLVGDAILLAMKTSVRWDRRYLHAGT